MVEHSLVRDTRLSYTLCCFAWHKFGVSPSRLFITYVNSLGFLLVSAGDPDSVWVSRVIGD